MVMSRCSSPMPAINAWPVASSVCTLHGRASSDSRCSAIPSFSWATLVMRADARGAGLGGRAIEGGHVRRRRQLVDDRVEDRLHAAIPQRRATEHRDEDARHRALAQGGVDLSLRRLLLLEV